ncbi:gliding motility-associated C-terminal domain-containing protein [Pedobacter frigiditerrae]|uniref:T9SS type B sorting domain-containing protein n=1 Tax=Pedobacter frigiditerrae TaxID=2530452 RepID=UPI00292CF473|nr:gliding motility-associated C-terminal domain-containing protein [Pedobacter frigiditerrae]
MRFLRFFILVATLFCFNKVFAQTYNVTSTADSGPGTLRQGLLNAAAANRTTPFVINFQLSGDPTDNANRTIRLRSALPIITSNTIIDGSSQAWPALGVSGAKIIIEPENSNTTFSGLVIGQFSSTGLQTTAVEIYGLYLRNFATITNLQSVNTSQGSGIIIDYRSNDITIGAPGKGNVISGNINGILIQNSTVFVTPNPLSKLKVRSNIIGLFYDGITANTNVYGVSASLYDCSLDVGGDNAGEGNVIAANRINLDIKRFSSTSTRFDINIINNKIGVDATGLKDFHELPIFLSSSSLEIAGLKVDAVNSALYVRNNVIGGNRTVGVSITNSDFILTGNTIGTDIIGNINLGNGIGVQIGNNAIGTIGGGATEEKNSIAYNNFGIETTSSKAVKITRNSMYCNKTFGIGKTLSILQPYIQILKKRADYVSGKATPNSEVELFFSQNCNGICEGKTYIKTVQAGSDGKWEYNGALSGNVTATASLLNATTSPFSTADLLPNEAIIEPVTCNGNGSITIPEDREGFTFSWVKIETDNSRTSKGNTQSITGLDVGTYEVTIDDGCKAFSSIHIVKDQKLTKPTIIPPTPACGQTVFTFTAEVLRGKGTIRYQWINTANAVVSNNNPASLPEGTYFVRVTDDASCKLDSDPITINRKPQPKIKTQGVSVAAACGKANGSIKGIVWDDVTGTATYKWFKHDPVTGAMGTTEVSTSLDLENVEGGGYTIMIYDQGQCSPVSQRYNISIYNTVVISGGAITPGRCGLNNGIISSPTITDADYYEWKDAAGVSLKKGTYSSGMQIGLTDLAPGTYTLTASNTLYTCAISRPFIVTALEPQLFTYTETKINTTCELINGSVTLNYTSTVRPSRFEWRNEAGTIIPGTISEIKNIPAGSYTLYAWDINNCQSVHGPFVITATPKLTISPNSGVTVKDGCSLKRGSVKGIQVVGGVPEYDYKWINEAGEAVQFTKDLIDVGSGKYRLEVRDKSSCGYAISQVYEILDEPFKIEAPVVSDIRICYVSDIAVPIIGKQEGTYQLFADMGDDKPILETSTGVFNFKVSKTADYYIKRKLGSCESTFTKIHIEVTHDNLELGNVMTPNGDGLNDFWMVNGLPDYKGNNIKVYTRDGQLVYESIGNYTKPFDGRFRGKDLPAGVYFYLIDLRSECKPISGSITILR